MMNTSANNRYLTILVGMSFFLLSCSGEAPALTGSVSVSDKTKINQLENRISLLASEHGMVEKYSQDIDKLEERDVYYVNFYLEDQLAFTTHDLKQSGSLTYYVYSSAFNSDKQYAKFVSELEALFEEFQ